MKIKTAMTAFILVISISQGFARNEKYVPGTLPTGFTHAQPPEFYGTYENMGKNGTIYDYINGGGEVYIKHGFREVTHIILKDNNKNSITMDIFDMGTPKNAAAAFADEAVCAPGFTKIDIGTASKSYHYEPDFIIYFIKGKYLVYLTLNNDTLADSLKQFAATSYKELN